MYTFIAGTNRSGDITRNSVKINDQLQERVNSAKFVLTGALPTSGEEVKIYDGYAIRSSTANSVTLEVLHAVATQNNLFRAGNTIWVALNLADEESAVISTITSDSGYLKLTMTANFANTPIAAELCGVKKFAGNIFNPSDKNIELLENIVYSVKAYDYTKIFDKELLNDTYEDRDARYIINDFCNVTINLNQVVDAMNYAIDADIQAEWIETGDGDNPTTDTSDYREGTASGVLPWTFSGGTATFTASPVTQDVSDLTGVASGTPTKGKLSIWGEPVNFTKMTSFDIRIGSASGHYASFTITPTSNDWVFENELQLKDASITGTPDWADLKYVAIVVTETASSSLKIDGIRIVEEEAFKHYPFVQSSPTFDDFRIPRVKPTEIMQRISEELHWYWDIDYERNIHLFPNTTTAAPFSINETSDNFTNLRLNYDTSRLYNRIVLEGGDETSENTYGEVKEGNGIQREWILKNKFKSLEVQFDNNTVTDLTESGTNTTNVTIVGHGLVTGDWVVNRTRSNAVREITRVDDDNFTVAVVTSQTTGDTLSFFTAQIVGIEGINDDTGKDYMSNFNQKSIRSSETEATLVAGEFLMFRYLEVVPILVKRTTATSVANMRSVLGYSNGVFEGQKIIDRQIKSRAEALKAANAFLNKYSNVIITASFSTNQEGLAAGQLITITDTASSTRNIDQEFLIQKVMQSQSEEGLNLFSIKCSSLLFGVVELLQQLLRQSRKLEVNEDLTVNNVEGGDETITITDAVASAVDDNLQSETITISDAISEETVFTPPFKYEPTGLTVSRYNLASYG